MRRTQIYLTEDEWARLNFLSRDRGLPKSLLIREAVDQLYLAKPSPKDFSKALWAACGIWRDRRDIGDPAAYVRSLRRGGRRERYLKGRWRRSSSTPTS